MSQASGPECVSYMRDHTKEDEQRRRPSAEQRPGVRRSPDKPSGDEAGLKVLALTSKRDY